MLLYDQGGTRHESKFFESCAKINCIKNLLGEILREALHLLSRFLCDSSSNLEQRCGDGKRLLKVARTGL